MQKFDVIVIGGGFAGILACMTLADLGLKIACIEQKDLSNYPKINNDGRASAISYGSKQMLKELNIWQYAENHAGNIEQIRITDNNSLKHLHFDNQLIGGHPLGFMLENYDFLKNLIEAASSKANITFFSPNGYAEIEYKETEVIVTLKDSRLISGKLLIAADGKNSNIRKMADIPVIYKDYMQTALVFNVNHQHHHHYIALERFFTEGPFAVLPLKDGYSSCIVWTVDKKMREVYLNMKEDEFLALTKIKFTDYLGSISLASKIFAYDISLTYAKKYFNRRMALIADAAHAIHPIAGQGLNLGIRDIYHLNQIIKEHLALGLDIGGGLTLSEYERQRKSDNLLMITATDAINDIFSNNSILLRKLRPVALSIMNKIPPLQSFFMTYAMGIDKDHKEEKVDA